MRYVKVKFEKLNLNLFSFKTKMTGLSKKKLFEEFEEKCQRRESKFLSRRESFKFSQFFFSDFCRLFVLFDKRKLPT